MTGVEREYSREDIIAALQTASADLDGQLSLDRYREWRTTQSERYPSQQPIYMSDYARFDSWTAACEAAGIETPDPNDLEYSRDEVLAAIRAAADELGEPLSSARYEAWQRDRDDAPVIQTVCRGPHRRFDDWDAACAAAGVDTLPERDRFAIEGVRACAAELGEPLSGLQYEIWATGTDYFRRRSVAGPQSARFDTWQAACAAAGIEAAPDPEDRWIELDRELPVDVATLELPWEIHRVGTIVDPTTSTFPSVEDLAAIQAANDWSNQELAGRCGMPYKRWTDWKSAARSPSDQHLARAVEIFASHAAGVAIEREQSGEDRTIVRVYQHTGHSDA